jgi:hypothetical protein
MFLDYAMFVRIFLECTQKYDSNEQVHQFQFSIMNIFGDLGNELMKCHHSY